MPHITSPSGFPAVSDAFDSIVPVSPATRMFDVDAGFGGELGERVVQRCLGLGERVVGHQRDGLDDFRRLPVDVDASSSLPHAATPSAATTAMAIGPE